LGVDLIAAKFGDQHFSVRSVLIPQPNRFSRNHIKPANRPVIGHQPIVGYFLFL